MAMTNQTDNRPDVLLISAGVGAGHNQAAKAILEGLRQAQPELAVEHVDILKLLGRFFRLYYADGFAFSVTKLPRLYGIGYWLSDRPHRPGRGMGERLRLWWEQQFLGQFHDFLLAKKPRLVVHTHFLAGPFVSRLMRQGLVQTRQAVVVTDNVVHRWWYCEDVEHWFLPSPLGPAVMEKWGIDPQRVTVSGMPIHPKWVQPLDRDKIIADWHLPADKKIVLLTGGTDFTCGPVVKIANQILQTCPNAAVVVLAGRNKDLLAKLSQQPEAGKRLFPTGFTDRGQELVDVASLMVTKPGGVTTAECLSKGTPMVLLRPVPGQEGGNARYFEDEHAAIITYTPDQVVYQVQRLLKDRLLLGEMSANARRLYRPGTQTIVEYILRTLGPEQ